MKFTVNMMLSGIFYPNNSHSGDKPITRFHPQRKVAWLLSESNIGNIGVNNNSNYLIMDIGIGIGKY